MIKTINHVGVRVKDMGIASQFYVGVLGFTMNPAKPNWLSLPNGQMIHLMPATDASNEGKDIGDLARHVAFHVDDLEAAAALLLAHGCRPFQVELYSPERGEPGRRPVSEDLDLAYGLGTIFVEDPDGNIVEFVDPTRGIFAVVSAASTA